MVANFMLNLIPSELECYKKSSSNDSQPSIEDEMNFRVMILKNPDGSIENITHYSDCGEIERRFFYQGLSIKYIKHYSNGKLYAIKEFENNLKVKKIVFNDSGKEKYSLSYKYDRENKITAITKNIQNNEYSVLYGYDQLGRVKSRTIIKNSEYIFEQEYRYDILNRVVEYKDNFRTIYVLALDSENNLLRYRIIDKNGNQLNVENLFMNDYYISSLVELNGHSLTVYNKGYTDNIMLRIPYINDEDLDFSISNILNSNERVITNDKSPAEKSDMTKDENSNVLPITLRKLLLVRKSA